MITHKHHRPSSQPSTAHVPHHKAHTSGSPHGPFEAPSRRPLAQPAIAHTPQRDRRDNAIAGAEDKRGEGRDAAREETEHGLFGCDSEEVERGNAEEDCADCCPEVGEERHFAVARCAREAT